MRGYKLTMLKNHVRDWVVWTMMPRGGYKLTMLKTM